MPRPVFVSHNGFVYALRWITIVSLIAVLLVNTHRLLALDTTDRHKCKALLSQGHWLDSPDRNPDFPPFQNWRVPGCLLHDYTAADIASCSEGGQVLFVGDTGARQVFWATARKIGAQRNFRHDAKEGTGQHRDLYLSAGGVKLKFIWDPWLNDTTFATRSTMFEGENALPLRGRSDTAAPKRPETDPGYVLIFIGGGLWHARHLGNDGLARFKHDVDRITAAISPLSPEEYLKTQDRIGIEDQLFFAPVFEPFYDRLSPSRQDTITPSKIEAMNDFLKEKSRQGLNVPWTYQNMTKGWPELVGDSGMHVNARVADKMADILLNFRCNAKLTQQEGFPFDKTCCSEYRWSKWVPILAIVSCLITCNRIMNRFSTTQTIVGQNVDLVLAMPVGMAGAIIASTAQACLLADRSQIFDKSPKEFAYSDFLVLLGIAMAVCLLSLQRIPPSVGRHHSRCTKPYQTTSFLPREQSDGLKGMMQLYMLVYGYTGASKVVDFEEIFQIFIAGYVFLSAYGHTMYFLQTKDYSLQRTARFLLRVNVSPVALAFYLKRPYASYIISPLISIWFLVVYATLRIGRQYNEIDGVSVGKTVLAATLVTAFSHIKGGLELICSILQAIFQMRVETDQWRSHLSANKYTPFVGMLVAMFHLKMASVLKTPDDELPLLDRKLKQHFRGMRAWCVAAALFDLFGFWMVYRAPDRTVFTTLISYIPWHPILSLVVLSNSIAFLRNRCCPSFAWIGRISLELYLLSNHIWLAGDGRGLLRIGFRDGDGGLFSDRWRDFVVLTPILFWFAWEVHGATRILVNWILQIQQPAPPVGLGIDGLNDCKDEEGLFDYESEYANTVVEAVRNSNAQTGASLGLRWRLSVVVAIVWLANFFNA